MRVLAHDSFRPEKEYILQVLLSDFLGLEYELEWHHKDYWELNTGAGSVQLPDLFFSKQGSDELHSDLCESMQFVECLGTSVLFGEDGKAADGADVKLNSDLIASAFVLLSRLEEYKSDKKDRFDRFPVEELMVVKAGLEKRPLVNEYLDVLWNGLKEAGIHQPRKKREYSLNLTHDVDQFRRFDKGTKVIRAMGGDLIRWKSPTVFGKSVKRMLQVKAGKTKDPYDNFEYLMDVSEGAGIVSTFYFMSMEKGEFDQRYSISDPLVQAEIDRILERGHRVAIHPGWNTFLDEERMKLEYIRMQKAHPKLADSRQHFLKFRFPETLDAIENLAESDSSLGFDKGYGFRCSVCYPYDLYHFGERRKSWLREHPLILMDTALGPETELKVFRTACMEMKQSVQKHEGEFTLLWHPHNLWVHEWEEHGKAYASIITQLSST